jgi:hypothetical protein
VTLTLAPRIHLEAQRRKQQTGSRLYLFGIHPQCAIMLLFQIKLTTDTHHTHVGSLFSFFMSMRCMMTMTLPATDPKKVGSSF